MTSSETINSQPSAPGWIELGRYFVVLSLLGSLIGFLTGWLSIHLFPSIMDLRANLIAYTTVSTTLQHVPPILAVLGGLWFALRHFPDPWKALGFTKADPHWFVAAGGGWIFIVALCGYGLSALGRDLFGADPLFGRALAGGFSRSGEEVPQPSFGLILVVLFSHVALAAISEVAHRGFVYGALRNLWGSRFAALAASLLSTLVFALAVIKLGLIAVFAMWFIGSLLNCWLFERSGSILPGMFGLVATNVYVVAVMGF